MTMTMTMMKTMMKTTTIYQLYWCNFIAICTTCRKKHSERLLGLGWQSSTKGSVNQEAADFERFVGYFIFSKIPHHARCLFACHAIHRKRIPSKRTCPMMSFHTVSKIVLSYATEMKTTPFRQISIPNRKPFSSPCWTPATPEATFRQIRNRDSWYLQCCDGRGCQKYS